MFQQDSVVNGGPITHSDTEKVFMMQTLKQKLSKYQSFIDKAFAHMTKGGEHLVEADIIEVIPLYTRQNPFFQGCTIVSKVLAKAGTLRKVSQDLSTALCDFLRDQSYLDTIIKLFVSPSTCDPGKWEAVHPAQSEFSSISLWPGAGGVFLREQHGVHREQGLAEEGRHQRHEDE